MLFNHKKGNKIRILIVIYGDIHFGGVSVLLNNLLANMDRNPFDFTLYAFGKLVDEEIYRLYESNGVRVILGNHNAYNKYKIAIDLFKILIEKKYDIIHCNTGGLDLTSVTMRIGKLMGVKKLIAHSHGIKNSPGAYKDYELKLQSRINKLATQKLTCSDMASQHLFGHPDATLICNGIDLSKFTYDKNIRRETRLQLGIEEKIVIRTVGRLAPIKNQSFILEIIKELRNKLDVKALIVGSGELRDELIDYSEKLGIKDDVIFIEANDKVESFLCAMDIFLLPSHAEGLSIAAIEAQAMDLPVWCSTKVPKRVAISEKLRFLNLDDGAKKWSESIYEYCTRNKLEDRTEKSAMVTENGYDIKASAKKMHDIYMQE